MCREVTVETLRVLDKSEPASNLLRYAEFKRQLQREDISLTRNSTSQ